MKKEKLEYAQAVVTKAAIAARKDKSEPWKIVAGSERTIGPIVTTEPPEIIITGTMLYLIRMFGGILKDVDLEKMLTNIKTYVAGLEFAPFDESEPISALIEEAELDLVPEFTDEQNPPTGITATLLG